MRKYTKSEREWLNNFNRQEKRRRDGNSGSKRDIMNKGSRVDIDVVIIVNLRPIDSVLRSSVVDRYVSYGKPKTDYTPRDYFTLPEQWFTHKWTDKVDRLIDISRGLDEIIESDVPGIVLKTRGWQVNRHFEGNTYMLGYFQYLSDAKIVLSKHNQQVTKSGYGVDYE